VFDPSTLPDRDNRPDKKNWGMTTIIGDITENIVLNPLLDPARFSLTPPADFEIVTPPPIAPVTENDVVAWLRISAEVNQGAFTDELPTLRSEVLRSAFNRANDAKLRALKIESVHRDGKAIGEANDADKRLLETYNSYRAKRKKPGPMHTAIEEFREEETAQGTFRYAGTGVKLGAADRIVCWYQLKTNGKYRAVYGDLTIKDIDPKQLPLPLD